MNHRCGCKTRVGLSIPSAQILTEHGYGMDKDTLAQELSKISNLPKFLYTFARCAEKDREALHRAWEATRT